MTTYVGIDLGATRVKAGLVNEHNAITREHSIWLHEYEKNPSDILDILKNLVDAVVKRAKPEAVGIGVPGVIDRRTGVVCRSPNYPEFSNFEMRERLAQVLGCPVTIDNDANCVIAGEYLGGVAQGRSDLIGLTLGTGVGGAIILDGKLWRGVRGMAGEFGHVVADPNGQFCKTTGVRGQLEMYPSLVGLREMCRTFPVPGIDPENPDLPRALAEKARAGDRTAIGHFQTAGKCLGRVLGGLLNIFDVKTILLTGGIAPAYDLMERTTLENLSQVVYPEILDGAQILIGDMGERAGILGAAMNWKLDGASQAQKTT